MRRKDPLPNTSLATRRRARFTARGPAPLRPTKVVVADATTLFRSGVCTLLGREPDLEVLEVRDSDELLAAAAAHLPDVVLIDFDLPPLGGPAAAAWLAERCEAMTILWSFSASPDAVLEAIAETGSGYLAKSIRPDALLRAVRAAAVGEVPVPRNLVGPLVRDLQRVVARSRARVRASALSKREREVLRLVSYGYRNRQIADELCISEFTVKRHVHNILDRVGLPTRLAAAELYRAAEAGSADATHRPPAGDPMANGGSSTAVVLRR